MEDKQSDEDRLSGITKANEMIKNSKSKITEILDEINIDDFKVDDIKTKMALSADRQKMKLGKSSIIDLARYIDEFEDATTADMIFGIIYEGLQLPKNDLKKRSAKNFNSILNYLELDEDEKDVLREMVNNRNDINDGSLPSHFTKFAIRNYYDYLDTEKWINNYNYLVKRLSELNISRANKKSVDLNAIIVKAKSNSLNDDEKKMLDSMFPYSSTKYKNGKITQKYKLFLDSSLAKQVQGEKR